MGFHTDRGQSTPIGTVLLFVIVVVGTTVTVAAGGMTLRAVGDEARLENVEHAMVRLDAEVVTVASGRSSARSVALPATGGGSYRVDADEGWLQISHVNGSGERDTDVLANTSLGTVVYEGGGTTIAYQGGGVWRGTDNRSLMISPPEFRYRGSTLMGSVVSIRGSKGPTERASAELSARGSTDWLIPTRSALSGTNGSLRTPINTGEITITVHSNHYVAWGNYFARHTPGVVSVDHENDTVTMRAIAEDSGVGDRAVLYVTETEIGVELD